MDEKYEAVRRVAVKYVECLLVQFEKVNWMNPMLPLEAVKLIEEDTKLKYLIEEFIAEFIQNADAFEKDVFYCDALHNAEVVEGIIDEYILDPCIHQDPLYEDENGELIIPPIVKTDKQTCLYFKTKEEDLDHEVARRTFIVENFQNNEAAFEIFNHLKRKYEII